MFPDSQSIPMLDRLPCSEKISKVSHSSVYLAIPCDYGSGPHWTTNASRQLTRYPTAASGPGGEGKVASQGTHVGVAKVPEPRLVELAKLYNPKKMTYATVQYVDLGGMQKESTREALASLRDVDTIAHVIRVFDDPSVPHAAGSIDPVRD